MDELPTMAWDQPRHLVITQRPHLVWEYKPEVTIDSMHYTVDLSIARPGR